MLTQLIHPSLQIPAIAFVHINALLMKLLYDAGCDILTFPHMGFYYKASRSDLFCQYFCPADMLTLYGTLYQPAANVCLQYIHRTRLIFSM